MHIDASGRNEEGFIAIITVETSQNGPLVHGFPYTDLWPLSEDLLAHSLDKLVCPRCPCYMRAMQSADRGYGGLADDQKDDGRPCRRAAWGL